MAGNLASINIRFAVNLAELSTQLQSAARDAEKAGKQMQNAGKNLSTYVTAPLLAMGGVSVKLASDFEESLNKVDVAFDKSAGVVQEFAKTTLRAYGIAEGTALDMAALFGDMATSMGLPRDAAAAMSTSLVGLAGDLASFKNIGIAQATTALNGVFTGETESLKMLGIVMTEANLAQFALSKGITKSIKDFSQAEKVQLRYQYVMQQTANAQGDFARTGGGAANQTRVMTEGLKELGAQIGSELLPYYTEMVKMVNDVIGKFKEMDPLVRKWIVIVGGAAAAIGPLLVGLGGMVRLYSAALVQISALSKSIGVLNVNMLAIAAVVAAAAAAYIYFNREAAKVNAGQKVLADVSAAATKSIAGEKAVLDTLVKTARDEKKTKEERLAAIKQINQISPEYLKNITLENINTRKTTEAIDQYVAKLKEKAAAQAAQQKRQELFAQRIEVEERALGHEETLVDKALSVVYRKMGIDTEGIVFKTRAELERYIKQLKLTGEAAEGFRKLYEPYIKQKQSDLRLIDEQITALDKYGIVAEDAAGTVKDFNIENGAGAKAGTIAYYEAQIKKLKELQTQFETTPEGVAVLQERIDLLQGKIDKLNGVRVKLTTVYDQVGKAPADLTQSQGSIEKYDKQIAKLRELQTQVATTSDFYRDLETTIAELQLEKEVKFDLPTEDVNNFSTTFQNFGQNYIKTVDDINRKAQEMAQIAQGVAGGFASAFENMSGRFLNSLSTAEDGLQGFFKGLASVVIKIIAAMLAQSMANAIGGASAAGAATGPAAIVTTPVFIAEAIAGILAAFAAIPRFETGGIVGGNSFFGDKILARVNSGEMILNQDQQRRIMGMIEPSGSNVNITLDGAFKIAGSDLELILARVQKRNNRNR